MGNSEKDTYGRPGWSRRHAPRNDPELLDFHNDYRHIRTDQYPFHRLDLIDDPVKV